jgi:hypothetical protein
VSRELRHSEASWPLFWPFTPSQNRNAQFPFATVKLLGKISLVFPPSQFLVKLSFVCQPCWNIRNREQADFTSRQATPPKHPDKPGRSQQCLTEMASPKAELSRGESLMHLAITFACLTIILNTFQGDGEPLIASLAISGLAFSATYSMIRWLGQTFVKAGFKGRDLCKLQRPELPECLGAVCAAVYLLAIIVFIPFPFYKDIVAATSGGGNRDVVREVEHVNLGRFLHRFPHNKVRSRSLSSSRCQLS